VSLLTKHEHPEDALPDAAPSASPGAAPAAAGEPALRRPYVVASWLREFGLTAWLLIGIGVVLLVVVEVVGALTTIFVPALFAALLGATFLPLADRLERWGVKRWLAALLVMLLIVLIAVAITAIVVMGVLNQFPTVQKNLDAASQSISSWLNTHNVNIDRAQITSALKKVGSSLSKGAVSAVVQGIQMAALAVFGIFIGLNILVYFLADGRGLGRWVSFHLPPVPQPVAYRILANSAGFLRGYIWGSTIIGLFNGGVMFIGALVLGVPLAATIGIVGWFTNYVPMFGAIIGGAFAVLIALGSGGLPKALAMLVVVIISNGTLQTVVSQFALGAALKLHPLAVLVATTVGAILFGAIGGVVAAPFLKIVMDASRLLRGAGLFDEPDVAVATSGAPPPDGGSPVGPPGGPPDGVAESPPTAA
jgi:predicted PurR-regulated permease PerM